MEINRNNYETFFLLYLDRELNPTEMSEVEKFVNDNADLQKEFSLLRQTVLIPVETEFDQKELLFRKEEKRRVIPLYWTRIAAAVAVLVFSGWLIATQLRDQRTGMASSDSNMNMLPAKKNGSDQKLKEADNSKAVLPDAAVNKIQPVVQQNITATKKQSVENTFKTKTGLKPENDLSGKRNSVQPLASANPDTKNPSSAEDPDGSMLAMQKSSAQGLQPVDSRNDANPNQISANPDNHSPALLIAATGAVENVPHVRDENAAFAENEDQTDNAISVVALNDKNKGITRLFKKLTRRAPTVENDRKVRVSVFQFSY
ncbi:MAG TPA: hypothetical protein VFI33_19175 [Puia sp.]|nr:hypothetical protein [Puia sp.]